MSKTYTKDEAIALLEKATSMHFSDEQLAILRNDFDTPTLVDACAGAGKTTIFVLTMLVNILTGKLTPDEFLGVTFSKKAQLEMGARFDLYAESLQKLNVEVTGRPNFSTFHALFYQLLRLLPEYYNVKVINDYTVFSNELADELEDYDEMNLSKYEYLANIFREYDYLINTGVTLDGATMRKAKTTLDNMPVEQADKLVGQTHEEVFYKNYTKAVQKYIVLKRQNRMLDFNDMKIHVLNIMRRQVPARDLFKKQMAKYKLAIIDEFQDIDNIQAFLLQKLLSESTFNRLIAIGDADQNIYTFRGSTAKYIIDFKKDMPNAKVMKLSTNYRTGGNILTEATKTIQNNRQRKEKPLLAFNKGGELKKFKLHLNNIFGTDNPFLQEVIDVTSNYPKQSTAIIVRFNNDRALVADWLAGQRIHTDINNRASVLQNNSFYKTHIGLLKAFWYNDFQEYKNEARRIGFHALDMFVEDLEQHASERIETLSDYCEQASDFRSSRLSGFKLHQVNTANREIDRALRIMQSMKKNSPVDDNRNIVNFLWQEISQLTQSYYRFMFDKHLMSQEKYKSVRDYLEAELANFKDVDAFFQEEDQKSNFILSKQGTDSDNNVQVLTLHQAKGLEFNNVFLYGLTEEIVSKSTLELWAPFDARDSKEVFLDKWLHVSEIWNRDSKLAVVDYLKPALTRNKSFKLDDFTIMDYLFNEDNTKSSDKDLLIDNLYVLMRNSVNHIEEERRLLYVGMTRAKQRLYINIDNNPSGLLSEFGETA